MNLRRVCLVFAVLFTLGACAMAAPPPPADALAKVLNDPALWGKDFPAALALLPSWRKAGEAAVAVFPDRMAGETRHRTAAEAARAADRFKQAETAPPKPRGGLPGGLTDRLTRGRAQASAFRTEAAAFVEDDSFRVSWGGPGAQLLAPGLTVATVRGRLGEPVEKKLVVLQTEGERRPVVLTLYVYLGGAMSFAESDHGPPGLVNRVLLDLPAMTPVLFAEAP